MTTKFLAWFDQLDILEGLAVGQQHVGECAFFNDAQLAV